MLDVFLSVDVEIWCGGWDNLDEKFPHAFSRRVYGRTARGDFGLPYTLRGLREHGLKGVFFVEPLFSTRFGSRPLEEIVGLIREGGQEIQLHLHPEWVDESVEPLLENIERKRQHLCYYTRSEQEILVAAGKRLIAQAGGGECTAFRAGGFAFNRDTLRALAANASVSTAVTTPRASVMTVAWLLARSWWIRSSAKAFTSRHATWCSRKEPGAGSSWRAPPGPG